MSTGDSIRCGDMIRITAKSGWMQLLMATLCFVACAGQPARAENIELADSPLFSSISVPGNLALVLSVEYPTALSSAYSGKSDYAPGTTYIGYFDPDKCYVYKYNSGTPSESYFQPHEIVTGHVCSSSADTPLWSGNFLNWVSLSALDSFRWVLTGGARVVDTETMTILEKANNSGQGSSQEKETPVKILSSEYAQGATPFKWTVYAGNWGGGTTMLVTGLESNVSNQNISNVSSAIPYTNQSAYASTTTNTLTCSYENSCSWYACQASWRCPGNPGITCSGSSSKKTCEVPTSFGGFS